MSRFPEGRNDTDSFYEDHTEDREKIGESRRLNQETRDGYDMATALMYEKTFQEEGRKLTADFKWMQNYNMEKSDIEETILQLDPRNIFQKSEDRKSVV